MGFELIEGVAVGAACVVLTTMLSSVTLLPALLGFVGTNIDKWHVPLFSKRESGGEGLVVLLELSGAVSMPF